MSEQPENPNPFNLTEREREVLAGVCDGLANKDISAKLRTPEHVVKRTVSSIFDKTGTSTRLELIYRVETNPFNLTERELEVAHWICEGLPNRDIAEKLGTTTEDVVQNAILSIFDKTGVSNRLELVQLFKPELFKSRE